MHSFGSATFGVCLAGLLFAGAPISTAANEGEEDEAKSAMASPDGKFVFQKLEDETYGIVDRRTKQAVPIEGGETLTPVGDEIEPRWAPNSKRLAVNAQCGGRYHTTELFEWTGKGFKHFGDIEALIGPAVYAEHDEELKRLKLPADTRLRRIWDAFTVTRWINADTIEASGMSTRTFVRPGTEDDPESISADFLFTIKIDKKGHLKIIGKKPAAKKAEEPTASTGPAERNC